MKKCLRMQLLSQHIFHYEFMVIILRNILVKFIKWIFKFVHYLKFEFIIFFFASSFLLIFCFCDYFFYVRIKYYSHLIISISPSLTFDELGFKKENYHKIKLR